MKQAGILAIGIFGLISVVLFEMYVPAILLIVSSCTVLMILGGTLIPINSMRRNLLFRAAGEGFDVSRWRCFEGARLDPSRNHSFVVRVQIRIWKLGVVGTMALVQVALVLASYSDPFSPVPKMGFGYLLFLLLCFVSMAQLAVAAQWLLERNLLRASGFAVANLNAPTGRYTFVDLNGEYHGGTKRPARTNTQDNTCLVFYSPANPQLNVPSFRLFFHRLVLG